jgi:hypothetical protein
VQAVGGDEVAGAQVTDPHVVGDLDDVGDRGGQHRHAVPLDLGAQHLVQHGAPDAAAEPVAERGVRADSALPVGDAADGVSRRVDAERGERPHRAGHEPFAARLVDHAAALLAHDDVQARLGAAQRHRQARRSAARDHDVMHRRTAGRRPRRGSARSAARR